MSGVPGTYRANLSFWGLLRLESALLRACAARWSSPFWVADLQSVRHVHRQLHALAPACFCDCIRRCTIVMGSRFPLLTTSSASISDFLFVLGGLVNTRGVCFAGPGAIELSWVRPAEIQSLLLCCRCVGAGPTIMPLWLFQLCQHAERVREKELGPVLDSGGDKHLEKDAERVAFAGQPTTPRLKPGRRSTYPQR